MTNISVPEEQGKRWMLFVVIFYDKLCLPQIIISNLQWSEEITEVMKQEDPQQLKVYL